MKYSKLFAAVILSALFAFSSIAQAQTAKTDWHAFSVNLVKAVKSGNPGLQQSAMQRIIQYADKLDVDNAVYTIARIYGFHPDPRFRRLAMVTLYKINTDKSLAYLQKYLAYEDNESFKRQACRMIQDFKIARKAAKENESVADIVR